jgi:ribokinase
MSDKQLIIVVGSSNTDMVIKAPKFPVPGETLLGGTFFMFPGGKGANQAVAAARLGGQITFVARVGSDIFGNQALQQFQQEGINTEYIISDPKNPSGVALITLDAKGENTIVVAQGANGALTTEDVNKAEKEFEKADIILMQLETPLDTIRSAIALASRDGKKVILNPAPAQPLPEDLFKELFIITPNESETETLLGIKISDLSSLEQAAQKLYNLGVKNVVITLGAEGAYLFNSEGGRHIPIQKVTPVDTTAAGDIFNGALAVAIAEGNSIVQAVEFANRAAALSVTRMGAQSSAPYRSEVTNSSTT